MIRRYIGTQLDSLVCDECGDRTGVATGRHVLQTTKGTGHVCGEGFHLPPYVPTTNAKRAKRPSPAPVARTQGTDEIRHSDATTTTTTDDGRLFA